MDTKLGLNRLNALVKKNPCTDYISCRSNHKNILMLGGARPFHNNGVKEKVHGKSMLSIMVLQDLSV
jgi:hypothetical protein